MEVVLLHSAITDSGEWDGVRPLLEAAGHRVLTPDLPGYGSRPLPPGELSLGEFVLGLEFDRAAVVGTSFGSRAALETALMAPDRVAALGLVSPNPFGWGSEVQAVSGQEEELFDEGRFDEAADLMVRAWVDGPERAPDAVEAGLRERVRAMQRHAYELMQGADGSLRRLEIDATRVQAPTLVLRGALDWSDVAAASKRLVDEIPDAREVVFEDCAHLPTMERPDAVAAAITAHLEAATTKRRP